MLRTILILVMGLSFFLSSDICNLNSVFAAPGGVDGGELQLWLKADGDVYEDAGTDIAEDGDPVEEWHDSTSNNNDATQTTAGDQPIYLDDAFNFNPTLDFDGTDDFIGGTAGGYTQQFYLVISPDADITYTAPDQTIFTTDAVNPTTQTTFYSFGASTAAYADEVFTFGSGSSAEYRVSQQDTSATYEREEPYIFSVSNDDTGTETDIYANGTQIDNVTGGTYIDAEDDEEYNVGGEDFVFGGAFTDAKISEVATYDTVHSGTDRVKVHSYLAIKYGVTLSTDYTDSSNNQLWDSTTNSTYQNDIGGIGRDDSSFLDQQKSKSENNDAIVTMDKAGAFGTDLDFVLWGNDDGALTTTTTGAPGSYDRRTTRVWKVSLSGTPGDVEVSFDLSLLPGFASRDATEYAIYIDSDTDFTSGATEHTTGAAFNGDVINFQNVSFTDDYYFILAGPEPASPGGISTSLQLWYRADASVFENTAGTNPAEDGDSVIVWKDQFTGGNDASESTAAEQPTYQDDTTNNINFNPVIEFDGTERMAIENLTFDTGANNVRDVTMFMVSRLAGTGERIGLSFDDDEFFEILVTGTGLVNFDTRSGGATVSTPGVTDIDDSIPHIWGAQYDSAPSSEKSIFVDGGEDANVSAHSGGDLGNASARFGYVGIGSEAGTFDSGTGPNNEINGDVGEVILYATDLSTADRNRVESYLGLKYGITLDQSGSGQDYTASDGSTTMWDTSDNRSVGGSDYIYDIAGIGIDNGSGLLQTKSKSVNTDAILEVENPGTFSTDLTFLTWANDDGSTNTTGTGISSDYISRITRIWRADVEGSPGTVTITFDLAATGMTNSGDASDYVLFIDGTDVDFSSGATEHTTGVSLNGDLLSFTDVNFSDGDFFTVGKVAPPVPGGIATGLAFWYKADGDVFEDAGETDPAETGDSVVEWDDASDNDYDASQPDATEQPTFRDADQAEAINFNPTIDFDGGTEHMAIEDLFYDVTTETFPEMTIFAAMRPDTSTGERIIVSFDRNEYFRFAVNLEVTNDTYSNGQNDFDGLTAVNTGVPQIFGADYDQAPTSQKRIYVNGNTDNTVNAHSGNDLGTGNGNQIRYGFIGRGSEAPGFNGNTGPNNELFGEVGEIILYEVAMTDAERDQVESYLAVKYGITKSGDYLNADGGTIWNSTTNASYLNDVTGIGRDDDSLLDQRKSKSVNSDGVLTIDKGGSFSSDQDYLIWGNDNASGTTWTATGAPTDFQILQREWRVEVSGSPGAVTIDVDVDDADMDIPDTTVGVSYYLIVDTDNDNDMTDETPQVMSDQGSGVWRASNVSFDDGERFTIAESTLTIFPGGVSSGLELWLRADAGTTGTTTVTAWADQSANSHNATAVAGPELIDDRINFNPALDFESSSSEFMQITNGILGVSSFNDLFAYAVTSVETVSNSGLFFETVSGGERFGAHVPWGDNIFYYDVGLCCTTSRISGAWGGSVDTPYVWAMGSSTGTSTPSGTRKALYRDGLELFTNNQNDSVTGNNSNFYIGSTNGSINFYDSDIAEVIVYSSVPSNEEHVRIQSYLAIKYGVTFTDDNDGDTTPGESIGAFTEGDYLDSSANVIWDYSVMSSYHNDIAGIGLDNASALSQTQSKSENSDSVVTISNPTGLGDQEFLLWGNDNDDDGTIENIQTELPMGVDDRLDREWRIAETGEVGDVTFVVDLSGVTGLPGGLTASQIRLIVDDTNSDFSSGADISTIADDYTASVATFNSVPASTLDDGYYFTIGFGDGVTYRRRVIVVESQ